MKENCRQCGQLLPVCGNCRKCEDHCRCGHLFDADELGLDPETDNTPDSEDRHA